MTYRTSHLPPDTISTEATFRNSFSNWKNILWDPYIFSNSYIFEWNKNGISLSKYNFTSLIWLKKNHKLSLILSFKKRTNHRLKKENEKVFISPGLWCFHSGISILSHFIRRTDSRHYILFIATHSRINSSDRSHVKLAVIVALTPTIIYTRRANRPWRPGNPCTVLSWKAVPKLCWVSKSDDLAHALCNMYFW